MLPFELMIIQEYLDDKHNSHFERWFQDLDAIAAAKITTALYRLEQNNFSNVKPLGDGVLEYKIDFGPGYRIYFGKQGLELIILLGGGDKKKQNQDIKLAKQRWAEYKQQRKKR
jgi:putative addiction module killer protein